SASRVAEVTSACTVPAASQQGRQVTGGGGSETAPLLNQEVARPRQRRAATPITHRALDDARGAEAGSGWCCEQAHELGSRSRSRAVCQPDPAGCSAQAGGVTPRAAAQASFSSGVKQQQCRQHCSASAQPQG